MRLWKVAVSALLISALVLTAFAVLVAVLINSHAMQSYPELVTSRDQEQDGVLKFDHGMTACPMKALRRASDFGR